MFEVSNSVKPVTTEIQVKKLDSIILIDTPGFNNADGDLTDNLIFNKICDTLNKIDFISDGDS